MAGHVPRTVRTLIATKISPKFREITKIVEAPLKELKPGEVLVKNRFVGINASDINYTAGRYDPSIKPPFVCGMEGLGEVVRVGSGVNMSLGQAVMYCRNGSFADYVRVPAKVLTKIPSASPEFLPFQLSGPTAAVALDKFGDLKKGETVLVTAAAGGTGQFAVQWAKKAGCHVIGTCSTEEKVEFLKKLGCDRPINYKKEDLKTVLRTEYKKGVDVVYESVGGDTFDTCLNSLNTQGRLIVIGFISGYESELGFTPSRVMASLPVRLLQKSACVQGFFLPHFEQDWMKSASKLSEMYSQGTLKSIVDNGDTTSTGPFIGLEKIADAVEYMYTKKNLGKIVVELNKPGTNSKL
ncbi:prostaglandin reductase-3-like [Mizuhopecten yessoensis]|uniref:15-oxoprostaglandin 13-reductase n=1 Tax=Mizuhopecten yessoensis TaxID=6573 RepID=A0A210QPB1_MIZYE|nr:prostaglandin reductase-3-like [Mizuhopecten yessoensis]OWF50555.1 Zinc-binding alcohol dehydrogenase domain-containing protein 2 [Mizuhopecten yessoensis]